nr:uncharacterized protein LOC128681268 [Plodia interpunctella]
MVLMSPGAVMAEIKVTVLAPRPGRRGKPKKCRLDVVKDDMRDNGLTTRDADDRAKWRRKIGKHLDSDAQRLRKLPVKRSVSPERVINILRFFCYDDPGFRGSTTPNTTDNVQT